MIRDVRPWRVGTKVGRTIYNARNELIGMMDDRDLAESVVITINHAGGELADTNARLVAALLNIRNCASEQDDKHGPVIGGFDDIRALATKALEGK